MKQVQIKYNKTNPYYHCPLCKKDVTRVFVGCCDCKVSFEWVEEEHN